MHQIPTINIAVVPTPLHIRTDASATGPHRAQVRARAHDISLPASYISPRFEHVCRQTSRPFPHIHTPQRCSLSSHTEVGLLCFLERNSRITLKETVNSVHDRSRDANSPFFRTPFLLRIRGVRLSFFSSGQGRSVFDAETASFLAAFAARRFVSFPEC